MKLSERFLDRQEDRPRQSAKIVPIEGGSSSGGGGDSDYESHEAAELFPLMEAAELSKLANDIRQNGLIDPIVLYQGRVLDGRNRLRACELAGVEPRFVDWPGGESPTAWVISKNLARRHLTTSQRSMLAVHAKQLLEREARERKLAGVPAKLQERGEAAEHAARSLNVSPRSVYSAARVDADGAPELVQSVKDGRSKISVAAEIATLPADEQREIVARGEKEIIAAAKAIRQRRAAERKSRKTEAATRIAREPSPAPEGPFRIIVVDPRWRGRSAGSASMSVEELRALPVAALAHEDCVLWLWAPSSLIHEAWSCLEAWGFRAKTVLTWDAEDRFGTGTWLRDTTELCILAVRGTPVVTLNDQSTLIREPRREDSRRPEAFYQLVEGLCPGSKLEMFAQQPRDGWQTWNADAKKTEV